MLLRRRTSLLAVPAAALALSLSACGGESTANVTRGAGEEAYIDLGGLEYQVQISRELNPRDVEDRSYFQGLRGQNLDLNADQVWYGVFIRVTNPNNRAFPSAQDFTVVDTLHRVYHPIGYAQPNPLVYQPTTVGGGGADPAVGSIAGDGPTEGKLLLFKVTLQSIEDRPLTLRIQDPQSPAKTGTVLLDV